MEKFFLIERLVTETNCLTRIKIPREIVAWSEWLIVPTVGFVELSSCGPISIKEIEWVEINTIEDKYIGRLVKNAKIDHTLHIKEALDQAELLYTHNDSIIRIL